jgi:hypothetical protein
MPSATWTTGSSFLDLIASQVHHEVMKRTISVLAATAVIIVFILAILVAATDPQGSIVYLFVVPVCLGLVALGTFLSTSKSVLRRVHLGLGSFVILFLMSALIPPLRFFSIWTASGVAKTFELFTGMTPYAWTRANSEEVKVVRASLRKVTDKINVSDFSPVANWEKICILGPYSTEADAAKLLGYTSATLAHSRVSVSDSMSALIFVNESGTLAVIDISRSEVDFAPLSKRCISRAEFPIAVDRSSGRAVAR